MRGNSRIFSVCVVAVGVGLAAFAATGCSPTDPSPGPAALDESSAAQGADTNSNGVRDDIDKVISQAPVTAEMRLYLTETAQVTERIMALDVDGDQQAARDVAYEIASDSNRLTSCPPAGVDADEAFLQSENLDFLILNTVEREAQYAAFSKLIDGRAFPEPTCEGSN